MKFFGESWELVGIRAVETLGEFADRDKWPFDSGICVPIDYLINYLLQIIFLGRCCPAELV